jgi:hypothetical protein
MKTPATSKLFTPWKNPANGVESYVLTERVAPVQQTPYFTSPSMTHDGRYLWFHAAWPPPGGRHAVPVMAVVDFELDEIRVYPETQHPTGRPAVDLKTGDLYWGNDIDVWKRGSRANDTAVRVNRVPADLLKGRKTIERLATHLTFSADGKNLNLDAQIGADFVQGEIPLDGSPMKAWETYSRYHNHAQFSPTDPNLLLIAHEYWKDHSPFDGSVKYHRLWTLKKGGKAEPLLKEPVTHSGHEWWDADGKSVWYVHYGVGIKQVDLATRRETNVWPGRYSHGQTDRSSRYLTADWMLEPSPADCIVYFYDRETKKQVEIINRGPLADQLTQITHLHPHPHFVCGDKYICHTTTVHDRVDVALVPTAPLREMTR